MPRKTYGQYKFEQIFALTGGWASVVEEKDSLWQRPFKFMGPIRYGKKPRRPPTVACVIDEIELTGDNGKEIDSVSAFCTRCEHETESYGTGERSVLRCLVLMREECPLGEKNFYREMGA